MIVALTVISDMSTKASRLLSRAGRVLIEQLDLVAEAGADLDPAALWTAVIAETGATRDQVLAALEQVDELVPDDDGAAGVLREFRTDSPIGLKPPGRVESAEA